MKREDFRTMSMKELEAVLQKKVDHWYEREGSEGEESLIRRKDLRILGDVLMIQNEIIARLILSE